MDRIVGLFFNSILTPLYKSGHMSANNGTILKIQKVAHSGLRVRSGGHLNDAAWRHAREDVIHDVTATVAMGPISEISRIGSISMDLERFCIPMATGLDFFKILISDNILRLDKGLPENFDPGVSTSHSA